MRWIFSGCWFSLIWRFLHYICNQPSEDNKTDTHKVDNIRLRTPGGVFAKQNIKWLVNYWCWVLQWSLFSHLHSDYPEINTTADLSHKYIKGLNYKLFFKNLTKKTFMNKYSLGISLPVTGVITFYSVLRPQRIWIN